jgi:hypothetical protein
MAQPNANPENERKKQIAAAVLGVLALIAVGYTLFGGSSAPPASKSKSSVVGGNSNAQAENYPPIPDPRELNDPTLDPDFQFFPIAFNPVQPASGAASRNIFAFPLPPPPPTPKPPPPIKPPPPTPTPAPPTPPTYMLSSLSPGSVYARTGDFTLTVAGDKFTPESRIYFAERELPTRFVSPQQLIATVPGDLIAGSGSRLVMVRAPDGAFSNPYNITINEPPRPDNFSYVGLISTRFRADTAIIKDKNKASQPGQDLETVQRGDVVGGRFKVLSISENEVVLVDTALKFNHRLPMQRDGKITGGPSLQPGFPNRPTYQPPNKGDDDEEDP